MQRMWNRDDPVEELPVDSVHLTSFATFIRTKQAVQLGRAEVGKGDERSRSSHCNPASPRQGHTMIYICANVGRTPQTSIFAERGLSGKTQGLISGIELFAKAKNTQLAYSGYKDNIEAFVSATASREKILVSAGHFPIPNGYGVTMPLPLPRVVYKLNKPPTSDGLAKMRAGLARYGLRDAELGKGNPVFTLEAPDFRTLQENIPRVCQPRTGTVEGYAQMEIIPSVLKLYQCVDAFLATNTYFYREGSENLPPSVDPVHQAGDFQELRMRSYWYAQGHDKTTPISDDHIPKRRRIGNAEPEALDLAPHRGGYVPASSVIHIAKPSPKPSKSSWGTPGEVPFHGGLLFPYFEGLLAQDTAGLRNLIASLFFRNFGQAGTDARDAFSDMRSKLGTFASTSAGIAMTHVLKGVELALQSQTHLFLLFDESDYLGFVLLGEAFSVCLRGTWTSPKTAALLRADLDMVQTRGQSLQVLLEKLSLCNDASGDSVADGTENLHDPRVLAKLLSKVSLKNCPPETEKELSALVARTSVKVQYKSFSPLNISWGVRMLTIEKDVALPDDTPLWIPNTGWALCGTREFQVFGAFGPRSFSFRDAKGVELTVPKLTESDPFEQFDGGKKKYDRLIVGERTVAECINVWADLKAKRSVRMDFGERAGGSRNKVFPEDQYGPIWEALKAAANAGHFNEESGTRTGDPSSTKRTSSEAFGTDSVGEVAW